MRNKNPESPMYCLKCESTTFTTATKKNTPHDTLSHIIVCHGCKMWWETDNPERKCKPFFPTRTSSSRPKS